MICKQCGKEFERTRRNDNIGVFCSNKCYNEWRKFTKEPNCTCVICNKPMYVKPYILKRNIHGCTCSKECASKNRALYSSGENNHQYGLTGCLNASFKSNTLITNYGYIVEYAPGHPFPHCKSDQTCRVLQHRLIVEKNYFLFPEEYFIIINGKHYLKQEYIVHHKNENKKDNRIENLEVMPKEEHSRLHCLENTIIRNKENGQIIGIVKSGKNGEPWNGNTVLTSVIAQGTRGSVEHRD